MYILGLTAPISENTSACILYNGQLLALCEEERFVGIKHAPRMIPRKSIQYCLKEAGITIDDIDHIAIGFDSLLSSARKSLFANFKEGNYSRGIREMGAYLEYFIGLKRQTDFLNSLSQKKNIQSKYLYIDHHRSHASSAARCSGYKDSVVITLDGVGEDNAGLLGFYKDFKITKIKSININQSLGWLYSAVTELCGFKGHSHEGKTMGLSAFGVPDLLKFKDIAELTSDGYFLYPNFVNKLNSRFKRRLPNEPLTQEHRDLAATVQKFLEEAVLRLAETISKKIDSRNLCLAGGVALNCDMNYRLITSGLFDNIFVQPASNDAGTSLGAALEVHFSKTNKSSFKLDHAYYGPSYSEAEIELLLRESKLTYTKINSLTEIAKMLADGKIVGWFSGKMEFGPRALGGRSILANPAIPGMKEKINAECKHRENWRPFAPSVLAENCNEYFDNYHTSPFMLMTFSVKDSAKNLLSSAIHIDGTARVQEVTSKDNPRYYELISEFKNITGVAALLDTSLNDNEKPICLSPRDAIQTFYTTGLDALVIENFLLIK